MCKKIFGVFMLCVFLMEEIIVKKVQANDSSEEDILPDDRYSARSSYFETAEEEMRVRKKKLLEPVLEPERQFIQKGQQKYLAAILRKGVFFVNGALIHRNWIITVAAQFHDIHELVRLFKARLGSSDCKRNGVTVPLKSIDIHPSFTKGSPAFDLALVQLAIPVKVSKNIMPIKIVRETTDTGHAKFTVAYWPRLIVNGKPIRQNAPERTKATSMRISIQSQMPTDDCQDTLAESNLELHDVSMCLHPLHKYHSVCQPDAGAPVISEDGLWGITSGWVSVDCRLHASPTIVTRITSPIVKYWIHENLNKTDHVFGNVFRRNGRWRQRRDEVDVKF